MTKKQLSKFIFLSLFLCFLCLSISGSFLLDDILEGFNPIYERYLTEMFPYPPKPLTDPFRNSIYLWLFRLFNSPTYRTFAVREIINIFSYYLKYISLCVAFIFLTVYISHNKNKTISKKLALNFSILSIILIVVTSLLPLLQLACLFLWWGNLYISPSFIFSDSNYYFYSLELIKSIFNLLIFISASLCIFTTIISSSIKTILKCLILLLTIILSTLIFVCILGLIYKSLLAYIYFILGGNSGPYNFMRFICNVAFSSSDFWYTLFYFPDNIGRVQSSFFVHFSLIIPDILFGILIIGSLGFIIYMFIYTLVKNKKYKKLYSLIFIIPFVFIVVANTLILVAKILPLVINIIISFV